MTPYVRRIIMLVFQHNANGQHNVCCDNCMFAKQTDIDGLVDCTIDGHSKDTDMSCEKFEPID